MLLESIISIIMGILAGTITGLLPGIHINLIGTILVSLSITILTGMNPILFVIFISSMAITHTFIDFIPSIFLGCPDSDTSLSILPGHELLKEGKGYEAIMLTAYGGIIAIIIFLILAFPLTIGLSKIYELAQPIMFFILIILSGVLIFTEKRKLTALFVFIITGILGVCALNIEIKEPLLPLLTGLFGTSMIVTSIKNKIKIPRQEISFLKGNFLKPIIGAVIASPLCGFLPGLGGGQAAVLGSTISKPDKKEFLILVGATNTFVMGISFISLYAISKTRTGAAVAIQELIGTLSWKILLVILITILISGVISFFLTKKLAKIFSQKIDKINYTILSAITIIFLVVIVLIFSGFVGLLILIASTLTGIYCNSLGVKKTQMMGCLLIPTMFYYFMQFFK